MRVPSLAFVWNEAARTLKRFPEVLSIAFACMSLWIYIVANDKSGSSTKWLMPYLLALSLGIGVFFCLTLVRERYFPRTWLARPLLNLGGVSLLALHVIYFQKPLEYIYYYRFAQTALIVHLLCAIAPSFKGTVEGFWQYNRILFLRFLLSALYTGTLYAGLVAALGLGQYLLGFRYDQLYLNLFWVLAYGFNTWFFLAGVPANFEVLDRSEEYPVGLKRFVQFVLLPLTSLYLVILYLYLARVLFVRELPKGQVGILVSSISVLGIFCLLLLHPLAKRVENRWIPLFSRLFYVLLLPLLGLLFVGIWRRITDYGFTEDRYLLMVMGIWLALMSFYFILSKTKDIRCVPLTLAVVAFVASWGPLNAFSVGERSQWARLNALLEKNSLKGVKDFSKVPDSVTDDLHSTIAKLAQYPGASRLQELFPALKDRALPTEHNYAANNIASEVLGKRKRPDSEKNSHINLSRLLSNGVLVNPKTLVVEYSRSLASDKTDESYYLAGKKVVIKTDSARATLFIEGVEISRVDLSQIQKKNEKLVAETVINSNSGFAGKAAPALLVTRTEHALAAVTWVFYTASGNVTEGKLKLTGIAALVTIELK